MNVHLYTAHITYRLMAVYNSIEFIGPVRNIPEEFENAELFLRLGLPSTRTENIFKTEL